MGFDQMQSFYVDFEAKPTESVTGRLSVNILGNVPVNPIDEIFYENRGRKRTFLTDTGEYEDQSVERVKAYQASVSWDDRWFMLDGFYRTGHLHWAYEGDFFGLYRDAYYGENIDIYNGMAPVGFELAAKRGLAGLKVAYGPQLWWGANPAVLVKYRRAVGPLDAHPGDVLALRIGAIVDRVEHVPVDALRHGAAAAIGIGTDLQFLDYVAVGGAGHNRSMIYVLNRGRILQFQILI
jgi:hypothetical protein